MTTLFDPLAAGRIALTNRIVMAPMTRSRALPDGSPSPLHPTYYAQRAGAGLIVSEGIWPVPTGKGYLGTPGLYTEAHVAGWKAVTDAVHAAGGRIVAQIMHSGRIGDPSFLPDGEIPVAPSAVRPKGRSYTLAGMRDHVTPRALDAAEIPGVIAGYAQATQRALDAGFDGVELHAASGYLPMQFLSSGTNLRTDAWGGSATARARFIVETLDAMAGVAGPDRVGIKLSPEMAFNDISDADPVDTYGTLVSAIGAKGLAYLHVALFGSPTDWHALLRPRFRGAYLAGGGLTQASATALLAEGRADAAVFGAPFIANPDLPTRFARGVALATPDSSTYYAGGEKGYIDYPMAA
ncbi:MAG: alkene reductase [Burkholderiales bacterium]|nr:alkene reductase [Burkholderiales bacterium]